MSARPDLSRRRATGRGERLIEVFLAGCAGVTGLATLGVLVVLLGHSVAFFAEVPLGAFLFGTRWEPMFEDPRFGVLPLVSGSLLVAGGAALVALPTGVLSAIFLSEYAGPRARGVLKPLLEVLAGIPTVVYGYFALTFVTPLLRTLVPGTGVFNAASASLVVGVMIIPTVASLSEDAMRAVPDSLRAASLGLGATRMETAVRVVVPSAVSGIVASFVLGVSRALGETMAVTIAAGSLPNLTLDPFSSVQTMTAYIVQVSLGEAAQGTVVYRSLFAVGTTLFLMTLAMNLLSQWVVARFRPEIR